MALLEIRKLSKYFGGLTVLKEIDFSVEQGEIAGLIGPNGAGKSTLFNIIVGVHPPSSGHITFEGKDITGFRPSQVAKRGIIKTYQANVSFRDLTVIENILIGHHLQVRASGLGVFFNSLKAREDKKRIEADTSGILEFFDLARKEKELAGELPHGYQRLLGIATAAAAKPKLLLLDEPVTGMNAVEASLMVDAIRKLRDSGITIVIVEHDMNVVMNLCDRIVVLHFGNKIAEGPPGAIRQNKDVIETYLGAG